MSDSMGRLFVQITVFAFLIRSLTSLNAVSRDVGESVDKGDVRQKRQLAEALVGVVIEIGKSVFLSEYEYNESKQRDAIIEVRVTNYCDSVLADPIVHVTDEFKRYSDTPAVPVRPGVVEAFSTKKLGRKPQIEIGVSYRLDDMENRMIVFIGAFKKKINYLIMTVSDEFDEDHFNTLKKDSKDTLEKYKDDDLFKEGLYTGNIKPLKVCKAGFCVIATVGDTQRTIAMISVYPESYGNLAENAKEIIPSQRELDRELKVTENARSILSSATRISRSIFIFTIVQVIAFFTLS